MGNNRVVYADGNNNGVIEPTEILEENNYYPFGLKHQGYNDMTGNTASNYKYQYNGKELQEEMGLNLYDFGARNYDPALGRWMNVDPMAEFIERSSPYNYSLNNPIIYIDKDGELPILINGRVASESERASQAYWTKGIVATILSSGIPNPGGEIHYVDGDRFYTGKTSRNYKTGQSYNIIEKGGYLGGGNIPENRYNAGYRSLGDKEFNDILSKLERNSDGKIVERIQIYTHSRGAAFGAGYTKKLMEYITANAYQFDNPNNVIDFVLNMAPHQSASINSPLGVDSYSINHEKDWLSGNEMRGLQGAFTSNEGKGGMVPEAHYITGFQNNIKAFTSSFLKGKTSQNVIDDFIRTMKIQYGIDVTVK